MTTEILHDIEALLALGALLLATLHWPAIRQMLKDHAGGGRAQA